MEPLPVSHKRFPSSPGWPERDAPAAAPVPVLPAWALEKASLSVAEVARLLGVNRKTVEAMADRGELPQVRAGDRRLIPTARFAAFLLGEAA